MSKFAEKHISLKKCLAVFLMAFQLFALAYSDEYESLKAKYSQSRVPLTEINKNISQQRFALLGIHGEFYTPKILDSLVDAKLKQSIVFVLEGGFVLLCNSENGAVLGAIKKDGEIEYWHDMPWILDNTLLPQTFYDSPVALRPTTLRPGDSLFNHSVITYSHENPPDAYGWTVLITGNAIFMPAQNSPKPPHILWIIKNSSTKWGAFSLWHSSPKYKGEFAHVNGKREIEVGEGPDKMAFNPTGIRYWPYAFYVNGASSPFALGTRVPFVENWFAFLNGSPELEFVIEVRDGVVNRILQPSIE